MPKISIIVPVYKVEKYLSRCIDSILAQTFKDFELILVDDGSPDNSGSICDDYAKSDRRIYVIHQENSGLSAARNVALDWIFKNSNSEWVCFIDSDDWVHLQFLELMYDAAIKTKLAISSCRFARVDSFDEMYKQLLDPTYTIVDADIEYTHGWKDIFAYTCDKLYKKELWKCIRFPVGRNWEDTATTYKVILSVPKIVFVDAKLYFYFKNPDGIVNQNWTPKKLDHLWAINKAMQDPIINKWPQIIDLFQKQYLKTIVTNIYNIKKSDSLSEKERKRYLRLMSKELRLYLIRNGKEQNISIKTHRWYYELAFPNLAWLYWTYKGLTKK